MKPAMPRPYSDDLRWRAIWIKEFLGYSVNDYPSTFRDCRVHCFAFFRQPFSKQLYTKITLLACCKDQKISKASRGGESVWYYCILHLTCRITSNFHSVDEIIHYMFNHFTSLRSFMCDTVKLLQCNLKANCPSKTDIVFSWLWLGLQLL